MAQRGTTSKVHVVNSPLAFRVLVLAFLVSLAMSHPLSDSTARVRLPAVVVVALRELVIAIAAGFSP